VAAGEGVLHPLKNSTGSKNDAKNLKFFAKTFFCQQTFLKFLESFLKIFYSCITPSRAATVIHPIVFVSGFVCSQKFIYFSYPVSFLRISVSMIKHTPI
jgi:hypothetical protein